MCRSEYAALTLLYEGLSEPPPPSLADRRQAVLARLEALRGELHRLDVEIAREAFTNQGNDPHAYANC